MNMKKIIFTFCLLLSASFLSPLLSLSFLDTSCNTSGPGAKCLTQKGALACLKKEFSTSGKQKDFAENIMPGGAYFFVSGKKLYINHKNKRFTYDVKNENCLKKLHKKQYVLPGEFIDFDFAQYINVRPVSTKVMNEKQFASKKWMTDLQEDINDKKFIDLWLPGSHDSGTSKINFLSRIAANQDIPKFLNKLTYVGIGFAVEKVIANWAKAQSLTIAEQLNAGVRYLDIRLAYKKSSKEFWTIHTQYSQKFSEILDEIFIFLKNNPKEIIALDIQDVQDHYIDDKGNDQNFGYSQKLNKMIKDRLIGIGMAYLKI